VEAQREPWNWRSVLRSLAAAGIALWCLRFGLTRVWPFTIDDAGIVYAYAKHLAAGLGPRAVVGGPIVEGYSDFSWVLLLTVVTRLGFDVSHAAKILGAALFVGTCVVCGALVRHLMREGRRGVTWVAVLPAVILSLCPESVVWAPSGLENALYSLLMMLLLWLDQREAAEPSHFPYSAAAAVGVALTRPEGIAYAVIISVAKLVDAARSRPARRQVAFFLGAVVLGLGAYHLVHYVVFREFVPNTFFAKAPGSGAWNKGLQYVKEAAGTTKLAWVLPLAALGCFAGLRRSLPTLGFALAALGFAV
jgi:hypothetical protein